MKGLKGRILKNLKSIPQVGYLNPPSRVLQALSPNALLPSPSSLALPWTSRGPPLPLDGGRSSDLLPVGAARKDREQQQGDDPPLLRKGPPLEERDDPIATGRAMMDLEDDEADDRENVAVARVGSAAVAAAEPVGKPPLGAISQQKRPPASGQRDASSRYRRPDLNSASLFDPDLLAAFEQAVMEYGRSCQELRPKADSATDRRWAEEEKDEAEEGPPCKVARRVVGGDEGQVDPLEGFEWRCPPGGGDGVVLYTTSLRGIRQTFEDCNKVRVLLCSFRVVFDERDVSMHREYREELRRTLGGGTGPVIPPRLFVKGRHIGGAEEVLGLHERGELRGLLRGVPVDRSGGAPCRQCGGVRFVLCRECSGSRKVFAAGGGEAAARCCKCNENGLVVCGLCRSGGSSCSGGVAGKEDEGLSVCLPAGPGSIPPRLSPAE